MGSSPDQLAKSVFAEMLVARGYEVLLLVDPVDEILFGNMRTYKDHQLHDIAKAGLIFGDELERKPLPLSERTMTPD